MLIVVVVFDVFDVDDAVVGCCCWPFLLFFAVGLCWFCFVVGFWLLLILFLFDEIMISYEGVDVDNMDNLDFSQPFCLVFGYENISKMYINAHCLIFFGLMVSSFF